jgi:hypothetical protein
VKLSDRFIPPSHSSGPASRRGTTVYLVVAGLVGALLGGLCAASVVSDGGSFLWWLAVPGGAGLGVSFARSFRPHVLW